jgi:serine/threonine protein kinase
MVWNKSTNQMVKTTRVTRRRMVGPINQLWTCYKRQKRIETKVTEMELVTYNCRGNNFEVPKRYEIKEVIGQGGYGIVVSAYDSLTDTNVAIKKIFNIFEHEEYYQRRILREVKILKHFRYHDNIVGLLDLIPPKSFEEFKDVYIVMELMDSNLKQLINSRQHLTDQNIQYFLYQILRGLKYVHSASVLHRDIKPSNILLNADMDVKLCDFGLSRGIDFETDPKMSTAYVATRWYRAPELLLVWDKASKALDLWSVGCIFAEMLKPPSDRRALFPGKDTLNQLDIIMDVCGTPEEDEIKGCEKAIKYMKFIASKSKKPKKDFRAMYPNANPLAIDLLEKLLTFDPTKRITVEEALAHPYLETMHDPEDEPTCEAFDFNFEGTTSTSSIKEMLYKEIMDFQQKEGNTDESA